MKYFVRVIDDRVALQRHWYRDNAGEIFEVVSVVDEPDGYHVVGITPPRTILAIHSEIVSEKDYLDAEIAKAEAAYEEIKNHELTVVNDINRMKARRDEIPKIKESDIVPGAPVQVNYVVSRVDGKFLLNGPMTKAQVVDWLNLNSNGKVED